MMIFIIKEIKNQTKIHQNLHCALFLSAGSLGNVPRQTSFQHALCCCTELEICVGRSLFMNLPKNLENRVKS
jgi:hypothetical protein